MRVAGLVARTALGGRCCVLALLLYLHVALLVSVLVSRGPGGLVIRVVVGAGTSAQ
ncbi:hypothetical protein [Arthrobacter sp. 24S4-2]|uniref:hypothetical protein n=1 Tax=Arthrobacter sp. 24S4-2 TaxID=2575374 RepID=UPI0015865503|nr:hypothetical protein [Arthrobacter sp. 24S4-2]